jgi:hypothetical protein
MALAAWLKMASAARTLTDAGVPRKGKKSERIELARYDGGSR